MALTQKEIADMKDAPTDVLKRWLEKERVLAVLARRNGLAEADERHTGLARAYAKELAGRQ